MTHNWSVVERERPGESWPGSAGEPSGCGTARGCEGREGPGEGRGLASSSRGRPGGWRPGDWRPGGWRPTEGTAAGGPAAGTDQPGRSQLTSNTQRGLATIHLWVGGSLLSPVERNIHWIEEDRIHVRHLLMWLVVELRVGQIHRHSDTSWTDMLVLQHSGADIIHQIILLFIVRPRPFAEFFALRINL